MTPEIKVLLGDITEVNDVDAIVNAANCSLLGGGGVDGAIHKAAGPRLREECKQLGGCLTGKAKITDAYLLPVKKIIHTVGPIYVDGHSGEAELLSSCYWNSLVVARQNGLRSVAFPSISTGIFHYPVSRAANVAITTILEFLDFYPGSLDLIEWVCFDKQTRDAYKKEIKNVIGA